MAVRIHPKHTSPTYERYTLDVLERAKELVKQAQERIAESRKLRKTSDELLEESGHRRK